MISPLILGYMSFTSLYNVHVFKDKLNYKTYRNTAEQEKSDHFDIIMLAGFCVESEFMDWIYRDLMPYH